MALAIVPADVSPPSIPITSGRQPWWHRMDKEGGSSTARGGKGDIECGDDWRMLDEDEPPSPGSPRSPKGPSPYSRVSRLKPLALVKTGYVRRADRSGSTRAGPLQLKGITRQTPKLQTTTNLLAKTNGQFSSREALENGQLPGKQRRRRQEDAEFYHQLPSPSHRATTLSDWQRSFLEGPRAQYLFQEEELYQGQKLPQATPRLPAASPRSAVPPIAAAPASTAGQEALEVQDGTASYASNHPGYPPGAMGGPSPRDWMWNAAGSQPSTKTPRRGNVELSGERAAPALPDLVSMHPAAKKDEAFSYPQSFMFGDRGAMELSPRLSAAHAALHATEAGLAERYTAAAQTAANLADRYRDPVAKLKEEQAAWRRKHDALVRRKTREVQEANRKAQEQEEQEEQACASSAEGNTDQEGATTPTRDSKVQHRKTKGQGSPCSSPRHRRPSKDRHPPEASPRASKAIRHDPALTIPAEATPRSRFSSADATPAHLTPHHTPHHAHAGPPPTVQEVLSRSHSKEHHSSAMGRTKSEPMTRKPSLPPVKRKDSKRKTIAMDGSEAFLHPDAGDEEQHSAASKEQTTTSSPKDEKGAKDGNWGGLLKGGKSMLPGRKAIRDESIDFDLVVQMAKKHNLSVDEVHEKMIDFHESDKDKSGFLTHEQFEVSVRKVCNVRPDSPTPPHLLQTHWSHVDIDDDGMVSFEEYVIWAMEVAYSEEVLVPDKNDRLLRHLAREHGFNITEVERMKKIFDEFDTDKSGCIEIEEFFHVIMKLMKCKNPSDVSQKKLKRYWAEADRDGSGEINFEEFLLWYNNVAGGGAL